MSDTNPFCELFNYSKIEKIYNSNKDKPWNQWLDFVKLLTPGKQGIVGLFKTKTDGLTCVFKLSQAIDNVIEHESKVMDGVKKLALFCPHFCKSFGLIPCERNPDTVEDENPFIKNPDVKYMLQDHILLQEFVEKSNKLYTFIKSPKIHEDVLYSLIKQVLLAMCIAQKEIKLSHYDLHSTNIMVKRCKKDDVFVYVLDESNQLCVPTLGFFPIIIDYGFSYIDGLNDGPLLSSMDHTDSGFTPDRFDRMVDPKLFLVTVSSEIKGARGTTQSQKLRTVVRNIFNSLSIDWYTGWDENKDDSASARVSKVFDKYSKYSDLFYTHSNFCLDIIHSLVVLPMEKQDYKRLDIATKTFVKEWAKIEDQITNDKYNLFILKHLIESARHVRVAYMEGENIPNTVKDFKRGVAQGIDKVAKFCNPINVNYEKMLCSLFIMATSMEGIYYEELLARETTREAEIEEMSIKKIEHMYAAVDMNIPTPYTYNEKTNIFLINNITGVTTSFKLNSDEIEQMNKTHSICRGTLAYEISKNK